MHEFVNRYRAMVYWIEDVEKSDMHQIFEDWKNGSNVVIILYKAYIFIFRLLAPFYYIVLWSGGTLEQK